MTKEPQTVTVIDNRDNSTHVIDKHTWEHWERACERHASLVYTWRRICNDLYHFNVGSTYTAACHNPNLETFPLRLNDEGNVVDITDMRNKIVDQLRDLAPQINEAYAELQQFPEYLKYCYVD